METPATKAEWRKHLRQVLADITPEARQAKSLAAASLMTSTPEFMAAQVVMLFLSLPSEIDTSPVALRAWQQGKTVVVPKVSWDQRRIMPTEISSLHADGFTTTGPGIREPANGNPMPLGMIDLVLVPGLGFSSTGHRIGRGMGFYDRFLAQPAFSGIATAFCFEEQVHAGIPMCDHDMPVSLVVTDRAVRRLSGQIIER